MYFIYILQSTQDERLYVGYTENIRNRLKTHNKGSVPSTKSQRPWKLLFFECYTNQSDALRREKYFKTTVGKRALKLMLRETLKR
tara:strand:+ start:173 stop:427 length:255 start_codon:yes stop_codon:yes gene_type:complete